MRNRITNKLSKIDKQQEPKLLRGREKTAALGAKQWKDMFNAGRKFYWGTLLRQAGMFKGKPLYMSPDEIEFIKKGLKNRRFNERFRRPDIYLERHKAAYPKILKRNAKMKVKGTLNWIKENPIKSYAGSYLLGDHLSNVHDLKQQNEMLKNQTALDKLLEKLKQVQEDINIGIN